MDTFRGTPVCCKKTTKIYRSHTGNKKGGNYTSNTINVLEHANLQVAIKDMVT